MLDHTNALQRCPVHADADHLRLFQFVPVHVEPLHTFPFHEPPVQFVPFAAPGAHFDEAKAWPKMSFSPVSAVDPIPTWAVPLDPSKEPVPVARLSWMPGNGSGRIDAVAASIS